ncbi:STAS domain-containing protein [Actinoplanes sp. NPDC023714]|uniref:STAS domain-containing protein n=1 Tax=Actinoplanes sp. NPDC023714 TaxID=3154322 RepID=UPI0033F0A0FE
MVTFEDRTDAEPDRITVAFAGDCDLASRDRLTAMLLDAVDRAPTVLVDMSAVEFLDSSGVHALVTAHRAAELRGRRVYVAGATGATAVVLEMTGLDVLMRAPTESPGERRHG